MKSKKTNKPRFKFVPTPEHYEALNWCFDNSIKIYPQLRKGGYRLVCVEDGVARSSGIIHTREKYQEAIWNFYLYIYNDKCLN